MNLERRIAALEARQPACRVVWCEPGETVKQADEAIRIRWLADAEAEPPPAAPAPETVVPAPDLWNPSAVVPDHRAGPSTPTARRSSRLTHAPAKFDGLDLEAHRMTNSKFWKLK